MLSGLVGSALLLSAFRGPRIHETRLADVKGSPDALGSLATANQSKVQDFQTEGTTPGRLRVVENSGVCETTPGVYQASGYGDITANDSIWFWFFEARNDSDTAPLSIWIDGGPGTSSMDGLFQQHGPCRIANDSKSVFLNPNSWNEVSNMLYIDSPIGAGFSYGTENVTTSQGAAEDLWTFLQIFFADSRFSKYQQHDFAIWTESYGGHYGPTTAAHFLAQNEAIANGTISGFIINLKYLGIGAGLTDPLLQTGSYLNYTLSNPYYPLVNASTYAAGNASWYTYGGCKDLIQQCYATGYNYTCADAQLYCRDNVLFALAGDYDVYYILTEDPDPYPPDLTPYLNDSTLKAMIGASPVVTWQDTSNEVYLDFLSSGDWMRNVRPLLETVIDAGVRTLLYVGDADYVLNYMGVEAMADALQTRFRSEYAQQTLANYTVRGEPAGLFKNAGTLSYVRIFAAGHESPAYKYGSLSSGEAALQFFSQTISNSSLHST